MQRHSRTENQLKPSFEDVFTRGVFNVSSRSGGEKKYLSDAVCGGKRKLVRLDKIELQVADVSLGTGAVGERWEAEREKNLVVSFHFYGFRGAEDFIIADAEVKG